jgi:uncharacterized protein YciI
MFVITLTYKAPLDEVDKHLPAHLEWLGKQYEAGVFLAWGRRVPRTGGVILAAPVSREQIDAIVAEDPFHLSDVADHEVVEFEPGKVAPGLEKLQDPARG